MNAALEGVPPAVVSTVLAVPRSRGIVQQVSEALQDSTRLGRRWAAVIGFANSIAGFGLNGDDGPAVRVVGKDVMVQA